MAGIPAMNFSNKNQFVAWENFKMDYKIFIRSEDMEDESDSRKVAVFLRSIGTEGRQVFTSLNLDMDKIKLENLLKIFDEHFSKKKNTAIQRHKFFTHTQG